MITTIKPQLVRDLGMRFPLETSKRKYRYGLYKCPFCGEIFEARMDYIKSGHTQSCGCLKRENSHVIKHGLSNHRLYKLWRGMLDRCYNMSKVEYKNYGGRGISVCERWHNVNNFIEDMFPSFKEGLTLDRINVDGNYEPDNCRWIDRGTQAQNTRRLRSTNTSGYRGVSWDKTVGKWVAQISVNNKRKHLGRFSTPRGSYKSL